MIRFDYDKFKAMCYLPRNTILVSFIAHDGYERFMVEEQADEVKHRADRLRRHPQLDQIEWAAFNAWVDQCEKDLIRQVQAALVNGLISLPRSPLESEGAARRICAMPLPAFNEWVPLPCEPYWKLHRDGGHIIDIRPVGTAGILRR